MSLPSGVELIAGNEVGHEHEVLHLGRWVPVVRSYPYSFVVPETETTEYSYARGDVESVPVRLKVKTERF
jgi:hypothetical protein